MSDTFEQIRRLVHDDKIRISQHAFRRLQTHGIKSDDLALSIGGAVLLENYPNYYAGSSILVLHYDTKQSPIHAVWGIETGTIEPAVLITTYRPDPALWSADFKTRKP